MLADMLGAPILGHESFTSRVASITGRFRHGDRIGELTCLHTPSHSLQEPSEFFVRLVPFGHGAGSYLFGAHRCGPLVLGRQAHLSALSWPDVDARATRSWMRSGQYVSTRSSRATRRRGNRQSGISFSEMSWAMSTDLWLRQVLHSSNASLRINCGSFGPG
ncbi:hypothetical protein DPM13_12645 [Paracoccus mutanolyticus]|uniref:Uncharacterized protein n=1 Tax=Paracoccus mutanolyticus TaxID=1499308 RepID=A0ABN5MAG4_9RHOB|nr:hypothetical protein [Paracoccus mutanolyticus]AWX93637.1 hypothetical protein DPM13_12645 [Paracoccus mutanolyticus]